MRDEIGKEHMTSKDLEKFTGLHERGEVRFSLVFERGGVLLG